MNAMGSCGKMSSLRQLLQLPFFILLLLLAVSGEAATSDDGGNGVDKDKEKCANALVGVATCLPYVSGEARTPPLDCCTGLKQVLHTNPECICLLVKDRNDPSLGLKINATLALGLPSLCHTPANISACPALLHLPPNSPDAKVFEDFANSGKKTNATVASSTAPAGNSTSSPSSSGSEAGGKRWAGIGLVLGVLATVAL